MKTHSTRLSVMAVMAAVLLMIVAGPALAAQARFAPAQSFGAGDSPEAVLSADFDADSKPDLAVTNENSDDVSVLLNAMPPTLTVTTPARGETAVSPNTTVTATFSEEMNPETINASTFKLYQYNKKKRKWQQITATDVACDDPCRTATLDPYPSDPSRLLAANRKHKAIITSGVQDKAGNALAQNLVWTFTTRSS